MMVKRCWRFKMTKATLYLDTKIYKAVKVKAACTDRGISELVNESLTLYLKEDALDIEAYEKRQKEPARSLEAVLKDLRRDGLL
jgi:hypothetical protein